ncbi:hypothetical protein GCM10010435_62330 [Winogradskya consettensis]|uniref:Secreted protein n=1 Tax=Winogradskya consettensis TaxID=113560 RepID=A0A919SR67_9ACTN|nr:hypothetical protein [Actinoplanes consettensis]GIM76022.1 hypothetical protein Aco04nite_48220 [Actinoplanes consettensis]
MNKKVSRPLAIASAITAVALGALAAPAPASAHWSCGRGAPADIDTTGGHVAWYGATARVGSSTRCAVSSTNITGWSLDYHCYAIDINGADTLDVRRHGLRHRQHPRLGQRQRPPGPRLHQALHR